MVVARCFCSFCVVRKQHWDCVCDFGIVSTVGARVSFLFVNFVIDVVAKLMIFPQQDLAKFGYRLDMKVKKKKALIIRDDDSANHSELLRLNWLISFQMHVMTMHMRYNIMRRSCKFFDKVLSQ